MTIAGYCNVIRPRSDVYDDDYVRLADRVQHYQRDAGVLDYGIAGEDTVILVRPATETDDNRAAEAVADVERLLQEIEPEISVTVRRIPHDDFETAVMGCSELIRTASGEVVVSLSGGARDVLLPLTVATMAHHGKIESTLGYSDIDGQVREWTLPDITVTPSEGAHRTLAVIGDHGAEISIPDLTDRSESAKSTITRRVNALEEDGLVTARIKDRVKYVSITFSGQLFLVANNRSYSEDDF
ncbi:MarR family transcriptional regulator [Halorubrum sp. CBA1125]|uniref:MarR family transcriptional regulator n=1 Tax=Halorubrum sp. CBA1125 TaxID=2668072 RepID=UPI0012E94F0B|nr:MarR family transcriptional regulator [Halorubrum sp. CBA1125]MUW14381.1 MarR family transcriptional regulator [Halorubrum sp. CBA1125]